MAGTINAKLMEEKLKKGWTTPEFARYLECTEEEFLEAIQKTFSVKAARGMKARLEQNDKRFQKQLGKMQKRKKVNNVGENFEMENVTEVMEMETEELSREEILETLREEDSWLRKSICEEELVHNQLVSRRKKLYENLKNKKERMIALEREVSQHREEIEKTISELNQISEELSELNLNMAEQKSRLKELDIEIKMLQKIVIYAYGDGEIESENFEVVDNGWKDKFSEIVDLDEVELLMVRQIKQLSKILVFAQYLKEQNLEFEITFESEEVQTAYQNLI